MLLLKHYYILICFCLKIDSYLVLSEIELQSTKSIGSCSNWLNAYCIRQSWQLLKYEHLNATEPIASPGAHILNDSHFFTISSGGKFSFLMNSFYFIFG